MFGLFKKSPVDTEVEQLQMDVIASLRTRLGDIEASQYEAAEFTPEIWGTAAITDADAALRSSVREAIRRHYRYERANNPVVARISNVFIDDLMGESGPLLKLKSGNDAIDTLIQNRWSDWWRAAGMASKLSVMAHAKNGDGEALGVKTTNMKLLRRGPITLAVKLLECDRLQSPLGDYLRTDYVDGIHLDPSGEPTRYDLLKAHPGTQAIDAVGKVFETKSFAADDVFHVFRQLRPEQHRGVSPWHPALPVMGKQRNFLDAVQGAAEVAARLSVLLKTNLDKAKATSSIQLPGGVGTMLTLPEDWEAQQMKSEHPSTTLEMFFKVTVSQGCGCFSMPVDRALGWAISGGYAAIRSQLLPYAKRVSSDRSQVWEPLFLEPLYEAFLDELLLSDPAFRGVNVLGLNLLNTEWKWPKPDLVVDPSRDATANATRLATGEVTREDSIGVRDIDEHDAKAAVQLGFVTEAEDGEESKPDLVRYRRWLSRSIGSKILDATDEDESVIDSDDPNALVDETFNLVEA